MTNLSLNLNLEVATKKLSDILGRRFGLEVRCISISDREKENAFTLETIRRNTGAPMIVGHNQLIVPLRYEGALLGATTVYEINSFCPKQLSEIMSTIELVTEGIFTEHTMNQDSFDFPANVLAFAPRAQAF